MEWRTRYNITYIVSSSPVSHHSKFFYKKKPKKYLLHTKEYAPHHDHDLISFMSVHKSERLRGQLTIICRFGGADTVAQRFFPLKHSPLEKLKKEVIMINS